MPLSGYIIAIRVHPAVQLHDELCFLGYKSVKSIESQQTFSKKHVAYIFKVEE
jgi:hypothetical protein